MVFAVSMFLSILYFMPRYLKMWEKLDYFGAGYLPENYDSPTSFMFMFALESSYSVFLLFTLILFVMAPQLTIIYVDFKMAYFFPENWFSERFFTTVYDIEDWKENFLENPHIHFAFLMFLFCWISSGIIVASV